MGRDPVLYLEDIIYSINSIERYTKDLNEEEFYLKEMVEDAVGGWKSLARQQGIYLLS